jgi:hypothetical protein
MKGKVRRPPLMVQIETGGKESHAGGAGDAKKTGQA